MLDIPEQVLNQVYGDGAKIQELVKAVNARKGPTRSPEDLT
jgi:hypothetical protein